MENKNTPHNIAANISVSALYKIQNADCSDEEKIAMRLNVAAIILGYELQFHSGEEKTKLLSDVTQVAMDVEKYCPIKFGDKREKGEK